MGLKVINIIFCLFFLNHMIFIISCFKIFKKESYNPFLSVVPIINYCIYLKICKLPIWTLFIPVVNIVVLFFSTYCIVYQYRFKRPLCIVSIFFPFIFLPLIAFSKRKNYDFVYHTAYIENIKDIDKLEAALTNNDNSLICENSSKSTNYKQSKKQEDVKNVIDKIDNNEFTDQIVYYDDLVPPVIPTNNDAIENIKGDNAIIELNDLEVDELSINNIDDFESSIINDGQADLKISQNLDEYNNNSISNEAIAFGGEEQIENMVSTQTKNEDLKCPRCGSSLVGANGYCPGCGLKTS